MNLELSITEQCNLRCDYCYYRDSHAARKAVMSDEVMEKAVSLALRKAAELNHNFLNITFFGGEPLLRMDIIRKTVAFARKLVKSRRSELPKKFKLLFTVNTNGTLLNDDVIGYLKKEGFSVALSLDGPRNKQDLSRKTVDGRGSFNYIAPYIPALVDLNAVVLMVITPKHVHGFSDAVKWVFKQGFTNVGTSPDFNGKWTSEDFDALIVEYEKLARFWYKSKRQKKDFYLSTIQDKVSMELLGKRQKEYTCFISSEAFVVATNGNVFPCSRFISSQPKAPYSLGNVLDEQSGIYKNILPKAVERFIKNDKKQCKECAIRYRCLAHECGCTSFYTTGSLEGVSAEVCTHERILCAICDEYAMKLYRNDKMESLL
ncbi:radical SAM/SPASM domain-containing protein [Fibrobacter succinogenes]|uniref:Radical SAM core domain-containing protein n=1 Tax=Fibrobacter succinogenes TaxID=833 RepID=A0A380RVT1_FIBSU|nr:radical SAM protein [Fibrobacter succinogenes]PWJ36858.1 uncharacterized protein IE02_0333 [Fibrobacter succinogenes subsp. elongatus]SUQ19107.1 uncharacterized protein SAMN05661053_0333 [Fibrobacter succinogenes]